MSTLPNTVPTSASEKQTLRGVVRQSRERFLASFAQGSGERIEEIKNSPAFQGSQG
jgi:hypothetical protein